MSNEKLNDLLQEWAAARIRFSSERSTKLEKIMDVFSEVDRKLQPSSVKCDPEEEALSRVILRKGPVSERVEPSRGQRGTLKR